MLDSLLPRECAASRRQRAVYERAVAFSAWWRRATFGQKAIYILFGGWG